jgi:hypothetical protein
MKYSGAINCCKTMLVLFIFTLAQQQIAAAPCPCDIYAAGGTPCVAAHSMVRALYSTYNGPLYQVKRLSDSTTRVISTVGPGGLSNTAALDSFLAGTTGKVTIIYDQSGNGNNLGRAPGGTACTTSKSDSLAAPSAKITLSGQTVYGLYMTRNKAAGWGDGYRNDSTKGMPTGSKPQGLYWVVAGTRYSSGCCWDYGNAETNNGAGAVCTMQSIYFGNSTYWGTGMDSGPWIMADLEQGLFSGGTSVTKNYPSNPTLHFDFVSGFLKGSTSTYTLKYGNAQSGNLTVIYDGNSPATFNLQGAIILGVGGDNSCGGAGNFFEGAIVSGRPADSTENAIQNNIIAAGYADSSTTAIRQIPAYRSGLPASPFAARYNSSNGQAVISYTLQNTRHVSMNIFNPQGRCFSVIFDNVISAGPHEAVWDARRVPAGIYICRVAIDGIDSWAGKIMVEK